MKKVCASCVNCMPNAVRMSVRMCPSPSCVWDNRFRYVDELRKMGANVQVDGQVAVFEGVEKLSPAPLRASDLRAGAAMVVAALMADGTSEIEEIGHIERGYENIVEKLRGLGADIRKVERMPAALEQAL